MVDNEFWNIVKLLEGVNPISCIQISIIERNSKDNVEIYKAHLVAKDFT